MVRFFRTLFLRPLFLRLTSLHPMPLKTAKFVSWHPQPGAVAVDAFSLSWANMNCYAFPPFSLLPRVLAKIRHDKAVVLLIAPVWPTQSWYPLLLQLSIVRPILLPGLDNLLSLSHNQEQHPLRHKLNLTASMLSGKLCQTRDFSKQAIDIICASWTAGTEKQYKGVWDKWSCWCHKRKLIYFKLLSSRLGVLN